MNSLVFSNALPLTAPEAKAMYSKPIIMATPNWNEKQAANNWCASVAAARMFVPHASPPPPSSCPPCRTWNNLLNGSNNLSNPNPYNANAQIWKAY
jgi:hypothetical protein